ncbi:MAG: TrkA family potassium uptake protein [Chloroflexi bacterium]|nr:TrkA family potassium uptake protein [Chloroflexota bacterium]
MQILVTGLGRFGSSLARTLAESGHEVVVLDTSEQAVQMATDVVDQAVVGDATNEAVLREVGATDVDLAVVAMAEVEASVLITTHLKNLGVPRVFAKASSEVHRLILERVGADRVVFPERDMALRLAQSVSTPGMLDYLELLPHLGITEIDGTPFAGQSLANLNLAARYDVNVLVIKRGNELIVTPGLSERVSAGDLLIVVGRDSRIAELQTAAG